MTRPCAGGIGISPGMADDSRLLTGEVRGVVHASRAVPFRDLWIYAQRPRPDRGTLRDLRRDHLLRRRSLFHPGIQRRERIEAVGTRAAAAVTHPRDHE